MNKKRSLEKALQALENNEFDIDKGADRLSSKVAADARPLLKTIAKIKDMSGDSPGPDNKQSNKADFLASVAREESRLRQAGTEPRLFPLRTRMRSALGRVAIAATAVLVMSGGVAAAAVSAGPTDALYPVKKMIETARQVLPKNTNASAELHLSLADTRRREIQSLKQKDKELAKRLISELRFHLDKSGKAAKQLPTKERNEVLSKLKTIEERLDRRSLRETEPATSGKDDDNPGNGGTEDNTVEHGTEDIQAPDGDDNDKESSDPGSLDRSPAESKEPVETEIELDAVNDEPVESNEPVEPNESSSPDD